MATLTATATATAKPTITPYLVEVDVAVVVVVHVLEPWQVEVGKPRVRPLVLVHVLVELRPATKRFSNDSVRLEKQKIVRKENPRF